MLRAACSSSFYNHRVKWWKSKWREGWLEESRLRCTNARRAAGDDTSASVFMSNDANVDFASQSEAVWLSNEVDAQEENVPVTPVVF